MELLYSNTSYFIYRIYGTNLFDGSEFVVDGACQLMPGATSRDLAPMVVSPRAALGIARVRADSQDD